MDGLAMRIPAACLALAGLTACGDPAWRDPATSRGTAALAPDVLQVSAERVSALKPTAPARIVTHDPLPPPPGWAVELIGKPLRGLFPTTGACLGNVDSVRARFVGPAAGAQVTGWGWEVARRAAPPRVLLVDEDYLIRGAGESGGKRPRVPQAVPQVTSQDVGWSAVTPRIAGPLNAWGLMADGKTVCKLGRIVL